MNVPLGPTPGYYLAFSLNASIDGGLVCQYFNPVARRPCLRDGDLSKLCVGRRIASKRTRHLNQGFTTRFTRRSYATLHNLARIRHKVREGLKQQMLIKIDHIRHIRGKFYRKETKSFRKLRVYFGFRRKTFHNLKNCVFARQPNVKDIVGHLYEQVMAVQATAVVDLAKSRKATENETGENGVARRHILSMFTGPQVVEGL